MKILGWILLIGGFLWLAEDVAIGFAHDQAVTWIQLSLPKLLLGDDQMVPMRDVRNLVEQFRDYTSTRHRLMLVPACLMLAGGLTLAAQKRPADKPASLEGADAKPKAGEMRWDGPAAWHPENGVSFHKVLLRLARRAIIHSAYFRSRKRKNHVDKQTQEPNPPETHT